MKFATFLLAMCQPLMAKIFLLAGISVVTIGGLQAVTDQVKQSMVSGVTSLPADMFNLLMIAGIGQGLGIIFGACTTKLVLWQIQNATSILGKNPG